MKKFGFRAFRPPKDAGETPESSANDNQATSQKRREQVRKAQRTHRERKEIYIKSLETEVLQLRTNEANLLQETSKLYAEIGQLRRLLTDLGVPLPLAVLRPEVYETTESPSNSVVSIRENGKGPQIHVNYAAADPSHHNEGFNLSLSPHTSSQRRTFRRETSQVSGASSGIFQSPTSAEMLSPGAYESAVSGSSPESTTKAGLQNIGVEFVLTLESPCLGHIQGNPKEPDAPSGHVLTASAPLLFRAPNIESGSQICTTTPWEAPNAGLETLLNLSQTLELDGEVTPVQAWNYIRRHPRFEGLEMERLQSLTRKLLKEVKCHGQAVCDEINSDVGLAPSLNRKPSRV
ncbi:hypothetical protein V501_07871 [Pseudogymnoascus sp. VKM F-4519 (FW-2642)]|nr:hypothetical protein V501_07871 [Pseudogymnoascus sp. VKM F-4519 (FW-2642)]